MKRFKLSAWVLILAISLLTAYPGYSATITKGLLGEQDIHKWNGTTADKTFTRATSTGGTLTLNSVGYEIDALITYGGGVNYTQATIQAALTAIGTTNKVTLLLRPGTWVISSNADWSAYTNVTFKIVSGAQLSGAFTITFPISAELDVGRYQIFASNVTVVGLRTVKPEWFGVTGDGTTDDTTAMNRAISAVTSGGVIDARSATYVLGAMAAITKPLLWKFNHSYLKPSTTGIVFNIANPTPNANSDRIIIKDLTVIAGSANPTDIVKVGITTTTATINTVLENFNIHGVTTTHALIWNCMGYGLRVNGNMRFNTSPSAIYLSHNWSDYSTYSFGIRLDYVDISEHTGIGITTEGGDLIIHGGIIEGCTGGGIKEILGAGGARITGLGVYFERNTGFDFLPSGSPSSVYKFVGGVPSTTSPDYSRPSEVGKRMYFTTTATSTGINVNTGLGAAAYLMVASKSWNDGNNTASALYLIRCGYDGDNYTATYIGGTIDFVTFSLVASVLHVDTSSGTNGSGWSEFYSNHLNH